MECKYLNCRNEVPPNTGGGKKRLFCNNKCKNKQGVYDKRRRDKQKIVEYLGGKCQRCGFIGHNAAMVPHHINPEKKEFALSQSNIKSWTKVQIELDKCILLCQNCHATIHATKDLEWFSK